MGDGRELGKPVKASDGGGRGGSIEIYSRRVLKRLCAFGGRDFALGSRREQSLPSALNHRMQRQRVSLTL